MLLATLLASGSAVGQSTPTTLYFHVLNVQDMPINTQEPRADYADDTTYGPAATTLTCLDPLTGDVAAGIGTAGTTSQAFFTHYGYGYPNLLEFSDPNSDGQPRMHPARGLGANVSIDASEPMELHWYLRTQSNVGAPGLAAPLVSVHVAIRTGDWDLGQENRTYDDGKLLFEGNAGPATLVQDRVVPADGASGTIQVAGQQGNDWVYEFVIPLTALDPVIPMSTGYNVRVDISMAVPGCEDVDTAIMPAVASSISADGMRPRIEWTVQDLIPPGRATLHLTGDGWLGIDAEVGTVFGAYDVSNLSLTLTHETKHGVVSIPLVPQQVQGYGPCGHACGHALFTIYTADQSGPAEPGRYNLTVAFDNLQGTAHRETSSILVVQPAASSPSLGVLGLLAALAVGAAWRRR